MNTVYSRILIKRSNRSGVEPTIPVSESHLDGSWLPTDLYDGEMFINTADDLCWIRSGDEIISLSTASGSITTNYTNYGNIQTIPENTTGRIIEYTQNYIHGVLTVAGQLINEGNISLDNGDIFIDGTGELFNDGEINILN